MPAERPLKPMVAAADNVVPLPARPDIAVRLDGVSKRFGEVVALHEGSLAVYRGELMTLLGPSGCGKTTLLNLVAGFLVPDGGEIAIDGRRVTQVPTHRREIGMMFQSYALFPHMTVAANVGYGLKMRELPKPEIARRGGGGPALVKSPRVGGPQAAGAVWGAAAAVIAGARPGDRTQVASAGRAVLGAGQEPARL